MPVNKFSTELQNAEASVTLRKCDFTSDALPAISKIYGTKKAFVISKPNKVQLLQFQTSGILLFMGVHKLCGPEILRFLPCMLQFWTIYGGVSFC